MRITSSLFGTTRAGNQSADLFVGMRAQLDDLQRQLSTGRAAQTYGGLGTPRGQALDLHAKLTTIETYQTSIQDGELRLKTMDLSLTRLDKLVSDAKSFARVGGYDPTISGRTTSQNQAEEQLKFAIDLLNVDLNGRYLFSGRSSDVKPVIDYNLMMNGTVAQAGVRQMVSERITADLGTGGLGRLQPPALAASTVTLQRDAANPGAIFGFHIDSLSTSSSAVTLTGPTGPNETISMNVTGPMLDGQTIDIKFTLPDGTEEVLSLKARANPPNPVETGSFVIGTTPAATAANLQAVLASEVARLAETALKSASAVVASQEFFKGTTVTPPQRVPAPAATAAALVPGTTTDTVIWYKGDDSLSPRDTALLKIGDNQNARLGAQANEQGIQTAFAFMAAMVATDLNPSDANAKDRYENIADRVRVGLSFQNNAPSVRSLAVELASSITSIGAAKERHTASKSVLTDALSKIEDASKEEVSARLLALQTSLQASYQTTSILSRLSLTNYLG